MTKKGSTTVIAGTVITLIGTAITVFVGWLMNNTVQTIQSTQSVQAQSITTLQEDDATSKANYASILSAIQQIELQDNIILGKFK